mgnify:CR=1 FL=1
MRKFLFSERSLVVLLFIAVLVTFSFAHNDSKKIEEAYMTETELNNGSSLKALYLTQNTAKEIKTDIQVVKSEESKK